MPVTGTIATDRHRLVRMMRCVRGSMVFEGEIAPRFDYGRQPHELHLSEHGALFTSKEMDLAVHLVREPQDERLLSVLSVDENDLRFSLSLRAGQQRGLVMESSPGGLRTRSAGRSSSGSSTRPSASGVPGWASPPTRAVGARRWSVRR